MNWSSEMKAKDEELKGADDSFVSSDLPDIRTNKTKISSKSNETNDNKKLKNIVPRDYSEWDKYDADKEILRMELEEEKHKEELERKQRMCEKGSKKNIQTSREKVVSSAEIYSSTEKQFLATQEKDKGNEYFKAQEYKRAIEHYSASIAIASSPVAYNNRAMAHIKLEQYLDALEDSNKVLQLEPSNVKALHRRGIAFKHCGDLQSALDDFQRILRLEPNNRIASSLAQELQEKIDRNRRIRMHITEEENFEDGPKITEIPDDDVIDEPCIQDPSAKVNTSWPAPPDRRVKCNKFGLPKVMCNCSGIPDWVRRPPPRCLTCKEIKERRKADKMKLEAKSSNDSENIESHSHDSGDSESDEESMCEHAGKTQLIPQTTVPVPEIDDAQHHTNIESGKTKEREAVEEKQSPDNVKHGIGDFISKEETSVSRAATSKSTVTSSPKVKSGRKMEARCLLPSESIKPVKVQVASKYTTKAVVKGEEETTPGVQAIQGLSLEDDKAGKISTPFEFINALQAAKGEDLTLLAQVLQRVNPSDLHILIGNKLDDVMLQSILECLEQFFIHNGPFVLKFLENLASLPRFGIVKMFLDSRTKQVIEQLFESLEKQGFEASVHLQEKYRP